MGRDRHQRSLASEENITRDECADEIVSRVVGAVATSPLHCRM